MLKGKNKNSSLKDDFISYSNIYLMVTIFKGGNKYGNNQPDGKDAFFREVFSTDFTGGSLITRFHLFVWSQDRKYRHTPAVQVFSISSAEKGL